MTQLKKTLILIIIAIITLCPITNATQNLPQEPTQKDTHTLLFTNSSHYTEKTCQINGYTHYKTNPNIETILDYIFTQSQYLLNHPTNRVYLNIKDNRLFLNREIIAHSRKLTPDEIIQYQDTTSFPTLDSIATNLHSLPNKDILIAKNSETKTDSQIGVFINIQNLKKLEPRISTHFKWISTASYYVKWFDTIYEQEPYVT